MDAQVTTFVDLFEPATDGPSVDEIRVPLIQRDYAQGRSSAKARDIRDRFVQVLKEALDGSQSLSLDFVYGDLREGQRLEPLDGQQRLTTLFLVHWYLAFRNGLLATPPRWTGFRYATRPGAELFCRRLVKHPPPADVVGTRAWIEDQPWHLHVWRHDPTIQSMLVMIDTLEAAFADLDHEAAWARLTDRHDPAVVFHLLAIEDMARGDELYIKMNSRGKPLTEFENFKAWLEGFLEGSSRGHEVAGKLDTTWADVLWDYRGDDDITDDEFMRFFDYLVDLAAWRTGFVATGRIESRVEAVLGRGNPRAAEALDLVIQGFDVWVGEEVDSFFDSLFRKGGPEDTERDNRVALFGPADLQVNLLEQCLHKYGNNRAFGYAEQLLLWAVLRSRISPVDDVPARLRIVRNLVEASSNELRLANMPALVDEVDLVMTSGSVEAVKTFNQVQVEDEKLKNELLRESPGLRPVLDGLEDNEVLRGTLTAIDLSPDQLADRAAAFHVFFSDAQTWQLLTGALLTKGSYGRRISDRSVQMGSPSSAGRWRDFLVGPPREALSGAREAISAVLDDVAGASGPPAEVLREMVDAWCADRLANQMLDWRYYLARYPVMRVGLSGIYTCPNGVLGYSMCMMNKRFMHSYYRDPFLTAIVRQAEAQEHVVEGADGPWFTGYETAERWLVLKTSGVQLRCVPHGFAVKPPVNADQQAAFQQVAAEHGVVDLHLPVEQQEWDGELVDTEDRVLKGSSLLRDLVAAGL